MTTLSLSSALQSLGRLGVVNFSHFCILFALFGKLYDGSDAGHAQPFGKRCLGNVDLFGQSRSRYRTWAGHFLYHRIFEHIGILHVNLLRPLN